MSRYVAISAWGSVVEEHGSLEADEDAFAWGQRLAADRSEGDPADDGIAVVALRQTVGQADEVIGCWGTISRGGVDVVAVRRAVYGTPEVTTGSQAGEAGR